MLKLFFAFAFAVISGLTFCVPAASASIPLTGQFTAQKSCPALQSIRTAANPGKIRLKRGTSYTVVAKNNDSPSHYLVRIAGADPVERWVAIGCGRFDATTTPDNASPDNSSASTTKDYLLALSWQPSFCETKPDKDECQSQNAARFDATNLVLHGLWPQGVEYCGVSPALKALDSPKNKPPRWSELPPIALSDATAKDLAVKMPGYASYLHLHEWYKHGTCYNNATPEEYFQESIALLNQVNASAVQRVFANNIGQDISREQIQTAFVNAFGTEASDKVQVQCKKDINQDKNEMIVELQLNLRGQEIQANTPIGDLLKQGKSVPLGCPLGEVDPAGVDQ